VSPALVDGQPYASPACCPAVCLSLLPGRLGGCGEAWHVRQQNDVPLSLVQVWVHGLMATMHAYLGEINAHIALHDVRMQIPL